MPGAGPHVAGCCLAAIYARCVVSVQPPCVSFVLRRGEISPSRPDRRPVRIAPTVTAAVSARSTWAPIATDGAPASVAAARSSGAQPPRDRPARTGWPRLGGAPPRSASATPSRGAAARRSRRSRSPRAARDDGTAGRRRGPRPGAGRRPWRPGRRPTAPPTERRGTGVIRSTPSSVSFCTTSSGRSPFTSANATVIAGSVAGDGLDRDRWARADRRSERVASGRPRHRAPAARRRAGAAPAARWWASSGASSGASRSATSANGPGWSAG